MRDGTRITIEEWASDNNISLTPEQIEDLADGMDAEYDMMCVPTGYGYDRFQSEENKTIIKLNSTIDLLARFIASKGFNIVFDNECIRESVDCYNLCYSTTTTKIFT